MDAIDLAITDRINSSPLQLTLVYPAPLPTATGSAPGPAPFSPLTGPATDNEIINDTVTPTNSNIVMSCLWLDVATGGKLTDRPNADATQFQQLGWVAEATAVARVLVRDAALDINNPYGETRFDQASYVLYFNKRFRVLEVVPFGSGSKIPISYHVWLVGD